MFHNDWTSFFVRDDSHECDGALRNRTCVPLPRRKHRKNKFRRLGRLRSITTGLLFLYVTTVTSAMEPCGIAPAFLSPAGLISHFIIRTNRKHTIHQRLSVIGSFPLQLCHSFRFHRFPQKNLRHPCSIASFIISPTPSVVVFIGFRHAGATSVNPAASGMAARTPCTQKEGIPSLFLHHCFILLHCLPHLLLELLLPHLLHQSYPLTLPHHQPRYLHSHLTQSHPQMQSPPPDSNRSPA